MCLIPLLLLTACTEPPNKELDRAQGAIDAARAAGAEQYATTEYSAAATALKNATDAVAARDYRLALNYALESHEHAQNAARDTADGKARVRADVDRALADVSMLLKRGTARLNAAERLRVPRPLLDGPSADLTAATAAVQKAGEAVAEGDYLAAGATLEGVKERVTRALAAIEAATASRSPRRRRQTEVSGGPSGLIEYWSERPVQRERRAATTRVRAARPSSNFEGTGH